MEEITKNPGFQHLSEDISKLLDNQSLMNCRLVNSSWKKILDKPKFLLKKFNSEKKLWRIPNDVQRSWKMLANELNDTDDDFNPKFKDENKLTFCMYIRQTKVPTQFFATRPNFLYVFTHIMRVIMGQKNC